MKNIFFIHVKTCAHKIAFNNNILSKCSIVAKYVATLYFID